MNKLIIFSICLLFFVACTQNKANKKGRVQDEVENFYEEKGGYIAVSVSGKKLFYAPPIPKKERKTLEKKLAEAKKNYELQPNEQNTIWYGRYLAYLYKYDKAFEVYADGLKRFPRSERILRHRGHRYISIRKFDKAIYDLEKAAKIAKDKPMEVEKDGTPNKANKPVSNTQFNIWYHLGLAYYLTGDYHKAADAYTECLKFCNNDDTLCSATDWLYMTYQRMGYHELAKNLLTAIKPEMQLLESTAYHKRLLLYKGLLKPDEVLKEDGTEDEKQINYVTQGYGVGNWYLYTGDEEKARQIYKKILETNAWTAFGYIAAEVDLMKIGN